MQSAFDAAATGLSPVRVLAPSGEGTDEEECGGGGEEATGGDGDQEGEVTADGVAERVVAEEEVAAGVAKRSTAALDEPSERSRSPAGLGGSDRDCDRVDHADVDVAVIGDGPVSSSVGAGRSGRNSDETAPEPRPVLEAGAYTRPLLSST